MLNAIGISKAVTRQERLEKSRRWSNSAEECCAAFHLLFCFPESALVLPPSSCR